jgi:hypothetical protein
MARWSSRGLWITQGFVVLLLVCLVRRVVSSGEGDPLQATPRKPPAAPVPQRPLANAKRSSAPGVPEPSGVGGSTSRRREATSPPTSSRAIPAGVAYASEQYRSQLVRNEDSGQVWNLDRAELDWLHANRKQVLTDDLTWVPRAGGGLKITGVREGSFAASRGLRAGDILQDINGKELDNSFDLEDFIEAPALSASRGWRVTLEREQKPFIIDYCAPAGPVTRAREH